MTRKYDALVNRWKGKPRRHRKRGAQRFESIRPVEDLVQTANSEATKANTKKAERLLLAFASHIRAEDPSVVTKESSTIVINLVAQHCNYGKEDMLTYGSVLALCQGLQNVYLSYGHSSAWNPNGREGGFGNPLIGNEDLARFRKAFRVTYSRQGNLKLRARPLTAHLVCDISEKFWFGHGRTVAACDVLLHAILVVGLNLGLRYDEVLMLSYQHCSTSGHGITLTIPAATKNSTTERVYELREWTGNTTLRYSLLMDPFVALLSWLCIRGPLEGYLFCNLKETNAGYLVQHDTVFSVEKFKNLLRSRLMSVGIGEADARAYSGHSLKLGSVQLHRLLGYKDEFIMELVKSTEFASYSNYCETYNDCQSHLPRFSSLDAFLNHARTLGDEQIEDFNENLM